MSIIQTPEIHHSSLDGSDINQLTHTSGTAQSLEFEIKAPIQTPIPGDKSAWNKLEADIRLYMQANPQYKEDDISEIKLEKLDSFTRSYFEAEYGCKDQTKTKTTKRKQKDPDKKKLRQLKRDLKKKWKNKKSDENIGDLKKQFFKVTRLLNILRTQEEKDKQAKDFRKQTKQFREDPYKFAKKLYNDTKSPVPAFDQEKAYRFFSETYSDNARGRKYAHPPGLPKPSLPSFPFKESPPTADEIELALRKKRNGAAPGPNGVPYLVYKKVPVLRHHLTLILQEMWPNYGIPQSGCGVTSLIYKNGPTDDVSSYRPITVTNTGGKILLSILATRALSYMKNNSYFDISIQKGFISDMAGCVEHTTMLSELLKNAKTTNRQITVCWTDLENAFGSLSHDLIQFALGWYNFPLYFREFVYNYYEGLRIKI